MSFVEVQNVDGFVDPAFRYVTDQDPSRVQSVADARANGLNCEALGHLVVAGISGVRLPPSLRCYEMYSDTEWLQCVGQDEDWQAGDLVLLGKALPSVPMESFVPSYNAVGDLLNWADCPLTHVAVSTGQRDEVGDRLLLHASPDEGGNAVWPMRRFTAHPRYSRIYRVCRPLARGAML